MTKKQNNSKLLVAIIVLLSIILIILIGLGGYLLGKKSSTGPTPQDLEVTIIDDSRCSDCKTDEIASQLKNHPIIGSAEVTRKDFSDTGVEEYLKENNITQLPAIILSHNNVGADMTQFLIATPSNEYSLQIGSKFNPFEKRSERGFRLLDLEVLEQIKSSSYGQGDENASITWIEYSELECPYCAKLHNSGTPKEVTDKYGDSLNLVFQHFPLNFHQNALPGAQILECLGEQKGSEAFYSLIETSFKEKNSTKSFLIDEAVKLGANKEIIEACLSDNKFKAKVEAQMDTGNKVFGITGTPGNILVNNETGEYEVISGAYPTSSFVELIDKLLK